MTPKIFYPKEGNHLCYQLENNSYWFTHRNNCIVSVVRRFSGSERFIDIGGGNGFVSLGLQRAGIRSVLLEPNSQGIKNARSRGLRRIIHSRLEDAEFDKESVGAAGIFDVIEHIDDQNQFLERIRTILKKRGLLFITAPALQILWSDEDLFAGHFRRYTINNLKHLLELHGFKVIYATYLFSILTLPIFLFRAIPSLIRKRKKGDSPNYSKQHKRGHGLLSLLLDMSFDFEIDRIKTTKIIPFGSSCLVVAQKI